VDPCPVCGAATVPPGAGWCSVRCRVRAWRAARAGRPVTRGADPAITAPAVTVAALYVQADGVYSALDDVDPWPVDRDATRYAGPWPVVAHPPCAPWGRARTRRATDAGAFLAVLAVEQVQTWGGVLEHPAGSGLWRALDLPRPGAPAGKRGGWTVAVDQGRFGHPAPKPTWVYVVGRPDLLAVPLAVLRPAGRVDRMTRTDRERTPRAFADWLVSMARGCRADASILVSLETSRRGHVGRP
jgi:hypothetical protein